MSNAKKLSFLFFIFTILLSQDCDDGYSYYEDIDSTYTNVTVQDLGVCFNDGDLEALNDIIIENNFI